MAGNQTPQLTTITGLPLAAWYTSATASSSCTWNDGYAQTNLRECVNRGRVTCPAGIPVASMPYCFYSLGSADTRTSHPRS